MKKKGESTEGTSEPARRSDFFSSREHPRDDARGGDVRGDAVVVHTFTKGGEREREPEQEAEAPKPSKSHREKGEKEPAKQETKSALERALDDKSAVTLDDLTEGLANLKLTADNRSQFSEVVAKSLFLNKLTLKEGVEALEEKLPADAPAAVIGILQFLKTKKGDSAVLGMVEHSKINILDVIAKDLSRDALQKLLTDSSLLCLMPASDLDKHVSKSLSEGKLSPDEILEYISKNTDAKQSIASLGGTIGARMGQLIFQDPAKPNLEVVAQYSKLLQRAVLQPKVDTRGMTAVIYALQKSCSDAKFPKGAFKSLFEKLHEAKLITWEGFDAWREDRESKTPAKTTALVQVTAFLDSIKPKEEEDEGDDEGDEED